MTVRELEEGTVLYESGQKINELYLIMKGPVRAAYPGGSYMLHTGDVAGLCEAAYEEAYMDYQAADKISVLTYPYKPGFMGALLENSGDSIKYFLSSLFRQINEVISQYKLLKIECNSLYGYLESCYEDYVQLCERFHISAGDLAGYEEIQPLELEEETPGWMSGYYATLEQMLAVWDRNKTDTDFVCGFILKASQDIHNIIVLCKEMQAYKNEICCCLMNGNGLDLFDLYSAFYFKAAEKKGLDDEAVMTLRMKINDILMQLENQGFSETDFYKKRVSDFEELCTEFEKQLEEKPVEEQEAKEQLLELSGSLDTILKYAECEKQVEAEFRKSIIEYKNLINKNSMDEDVRKLRQKITDLFYKVYIAAFQVSVQDEKLSPVLQMFFDFGYVDEELAGIKNALYMYRIAGKLPTAPDQGIYSAYEWLMAIYEGRKEPGRNEFDMDYSEYLREQKRQGKISSEQEAQLADSNSAKVMYELEHVFPIVNKMTFGRISTFCPVFSEHNVLKPLNTILVTEEKIVKTLERIRKIDYSAFYRETVYSQPEKGIPKEYIDVEVLPDIILAPNAGTRGALWQEIEGRRRTTPARMVSSIFQMEDIALILIRLTGEFRWEMCKRVQGARWNDVSDRSLTSEYFDYIQFYRKNQDLSGDAKDKIKTDMTKAKNSFKEMFIRDYVIWVLYESNGSPRLNKVARNLLFTYCPFAKEVRDKLKINPMYKEMIDRYNIRMGQKLHHMNNLYQKLRNMGKAVPEEIEKQREFLES